jgi:hypothetical protein
MKNFICLIFFLPFFVDAQTSYTEEQKIDHLIAYVGTLKDAIFIRNSSEYKPLDAANHLKMKYEKAGDKIKTAEDFIEKIASVSSMSGEPYKIKFSNGKVFNCELILKIELKKLFEGKVKLLD